MPGPRTVAAEPILRTGRHAAPVRFAS